MIEVEQLTKDYGTVLAVRGISFRVGGGEVVGLLGPNGAGKSTTMRILAGYLGATEGRVNVAGHDMADDALAARASIGYMPENAPAYPELRVREYLEFRAALKKVPRKERKARVEHAMQRAGVSERGSSLIRHLSKGYRQRVGLADALVANPPLLILDEPTAGLDPNQIREVRHLVRELGKDHTILLSTHILSEVESTCDRAIVIDQGRLVAEGSLDELRSLRHATTARLELRDPEGRASKLLRALKGVSKARTLKGVEAPLARLRISFDTTASSPLDILEEAVAQLAGAHVGIREAYLEKPTLEQVFAQLTGSEEGEA